MPNLTTPILATGYFRSRGIKIISIIEEIDSPGIMVLFLVFFL
jgi:hypothetical protein